MITACSISKIVNGYILWKIRKVENFSKIEFQKFKVRFRMYNPTSDEFGKKFLNGV